MTDTNDAKGPRISDPVMLEEPIVRGDTEIKSVQVRKPKSGELRGLSMHDLVKLDVDTVRTLLPRVTIPALITAEVDDLEPGDLLALSGEIANFFLPKEMRPDSQAQ
jgi:hypothetical protein